MRRHASDRGARLGQRGANDPARRQAWVGTPAIAMIGRVKHHLSHDRCDTGSAQRVRCCGPWVVWWANDANQHDRNLVTWH